MIQKRFLNFQEPFFVDIIRVLETLLLDKHDTCLKQFFKVRKFKIGTTRAEGSIGALKAVKISLNAAWF